MHIMRSVQLAQNERLFFAWKNGTCRRRLEKGKVDEKTGRPFPFRFSALFKWNKKRGIPLFHFGNCTSHPNQNML